MLTKSFEIIKEFPFELVGHHIWVHRELLVPVSRADQIKFPTPVRALYPGMSGKISFYGITTNPNGVRMLSLSNGRVTRYYWFNGKRTTTYLVRSKSSDLEEAWLNLFKSLIKDTGSKVITNYEIFKEFMLDYIKHLGDKELSLSLSAVVNGELFYIEVEKTYCMTKAVTLIVNGSEKLVDFNKHPLLEALDK